MCVRPPESDDDDDDAVCPFGCCKAEGLPASCQCVCVRAWLQHLCVKRVTVCELPIYAYSTQPVEKQ